MDGSFPMPSTITQVWVPSRADIKKLVKLRYYQAHNKFIPTARASVLDPVANRLGMSLTSSYPVKISAIKDLEFLSRDIIRLLSQAEKKKLHKEILLLLDLLITVPSSLLLEKEKGNGTSLKKKHTSLRPFKHD